MTAFKFSSLWLLFAATYVVFYVIIFALFPEREVYFFFRERYDIFIEEGTWDTIFMLAVLLSALVANIAFIFLSFAGICFLRNRKKQSD